MAEYRSRPSTEKWEPFKGCTEECAAPVPCPTCGRDLPPIGRSVGMEAYLAPCCDEARFDSKLNTRHVWSVDELPVTEKETNR